MNGTRILVCAHKPDYTCREPGYFPIHVGKAISSHNLDMQGDDTGDNISHLNPNYCELTAHYWLWKNTDCPRWVGLNHYRRYFDFRHRRGSLRPVYNVPLEWIEKYPPTLPDMDRFMEGYDVLLPYQHHYPYNLQTDYCAAHIVEDYKILENTLKEMTPEYSDAFDKVMGGNRLSHFNMFVMSRENFDKYSEWLFAILFEVAKKVKISEYPSQARIFGYMSERLLNVWVLHNRLRVKHVNVLMVGDNPNRPLWREAFTRLRRDVAAKLSF